MEVQRAHSAVIIGGGPAGLTAALELARRQVPTTVLEKGAIVGGLARTESHRGFRFDLGGHRFFTKVPQVEAWWRELLGAEFLRRPRLSRIFYDGKYVAYPLKPWNALGALGVGQAVLVVASYLRWQLRPYPREDTFEQWVTNRFGRRLFRIFFKTYTEKVWGVSCSELKAEWAAQRIKDLSLRTAILNMVTQPRTTITTLIEEFDYPRLGPGMMWEAARDEIARLGGEVRTGAEVVGILRTDARVTGVVVEEQGRRRIVEATHVVSSMPVTELVMRLDPPPPPEIVAAAAALRYRDFLTVCLVVNRAELFPDNWIYVHDPEVQVGRIQNFKNWSPAMVPDQSQSSLGLEYFCDEGDALWTSSDADLVALGTREIERLGLADGRDVVDGCVVRVPKAYPIYDGGYREHLERIRGYVAGLANLQTIGRNGLHRYNNQDHAMLTGMLAVRNLLDGESNDLWSVNTDAEYHEERRETAAAAGTSASPDAALPVSFPKLDRMALGVACAVVAGIGLWLATILLVLKGGAEIGPHLGLLAQFLPGYRVSVGGSVIGFAYGLGLGFAGGWTFAVLRNATALALLAVVRRRVERKALGRLFDYV